VRNVLNASWDSIATSAVATSIPEPFLLRDKTSSYEFLQHGADGFIIFSTTYPTEPSQFLARNPEGVPLMCLAG
jgi:hypothetical protein